MLKRLIVRAGLVSAVIVGVLLTSCGTKASNQGFTTIAPMTGSSAGQTAGSDTGAQTASSNKTSLSPSQTSSITTKAQPTTLTMSSVPLKPVETRLPTPLYPKAQRPKWPEESSLEFIRSIDLTQWKNRNSADKPLRGIAVIVDPGHGGIDGGAQYPIKGKNPEYIEKDINLSISKMLEKHLKDLGASVFMTRTEDVWVSVYNRIAQTARYILGRYSEDLKSAGYSDEPLQPLLPKLDEMIRLNSDQSGGPGLGIFLGAGVAADQKLVMDVCHQYPDVLLLSIHCNSMNDSRIHGLKVLYLTADNARASENPYAVGGPPSYHLYDDVNRKRLASLIVDKITGAVPDLAFPSASRGVDEQNLALLRELNLVSVMVETGFLSNENDRRLLADAGAQAKIAAAIADAVYTYYCG